jgi:hypothetical protein
MKNKLTQKMLKEILRYDPDSGLFYWKVSLNKKIKRDEVAGCLHSSGYIYIAIYKKLYLAHRLAYIYMTGKWPIKQIDHINGNRSDNRFINLRDSSNSENHQNRKNTAILMGAHWVAKEKKYVSSITVNYHKIHLGTFSTAKDAHMAYCKAKKKYHLFNQTTRGENNGQSN